MGAMTVAVSWSGYFNKLLHLFGISMPYYLTNDPFSAKQYAIDNNFIDENILYFDNTITTKKQLETEWIIPAGHSWLSKMFKTV